MGNSRCSRESVDSNSGLPRRTKGFGVIFGDGDLEKKYRVEEPRWGDRLHPIFELFTKFLELPQDPEVFLYLYTFFSPNTEGKPKKGYMSTWPGKYRKIFGLYEDSFHDFKGRFSKIFPVEGHRPFWLSLKGDDRFPSFWSSGAGLEYVSVTYKRLNAEQKDIADILVFFSKDNLSPKSLLGNPPEARTVVDMPFLPNALFSFPLYFCFKVFLFSSFLAMTMVCNDTTLDHLCHLIRPSSSGLVTSVQALLQVARGI
ncbi:hypothetical protein PIB30_084363 [Stylosanthes scabra]|uniref:Uncharacterized protein n=1 Tax=Stylosanthes scabra TaxID=79078 RepID=A0ABU6RT06_9FABA|nr:hypothetical protein [Stylosanthes scabra]